MYPRIGVTAILKGQRGVTADTALRLARYFGTTPQLWQNLQKAFELRVAEIESGPLIEERVATTGGDASGWRVSRQLAATYHWDRTWSFYAPSREGAYGRC